MTERSDVTYPPMNMVYAPAQWTGNGQPSTQYSSPAAYYPASPYAASQANHSRAPYGSSRSTQSSTGQNANYPPYQSVTNRSPTSVQQQQMYTHPAPQPQQLRQPVVQPRSHSMQAYLPPGTSPQMIASPPHSPPQYHPQMAYGQPMSNGMQYPASPNRPFCCDMCALSFNRQHDLKRHRETHSGEKPFLCNGGCGKTFTRKDALKRHQVRVINAFTEFI